MSTSAAETPSPSYRIVDGLAEQDRAIDELLSLARLHVRVFDHDLRERAWSGAARARMLQRFLQGSREARLDVILQDTQHVERACPHLLALLRTYSGAMTVYRAGPGARAAADPLLLVDGRHFVHRLHYTQPRAVVAIDQPSLARPLEQRFDEIWATGETGIAGDVLGL